MLAETLPPASVGVTVKLYDDLSSAIVSGEIAPGAKLSEPAIARRFGVSRAPVREAIRRLQERGLVTYVANQGARVAEPSAAEFLALLDVREATEGMAARLAAESMSEAEIASALEVTERTVRRDWRKARAFLQLDMSRAGMG